MNSKKLLVSFLGIAYGLLALVPSCHAASNLAINKSYTLSVKPNYPHSAPPSDTTSLTDGNNSTGVFWMQKSTIGWQGARNIEILIDLEKESNVGTISFSTVRDATSDVYFPAHVYAFVGPDREHLSYAGDLAAVTGNLPGSYQLKRFMQNDIGLMGRYVFLLVESKGYYLFCDEIEVFEGASRNKATGSLSPEKAREYIEQIKRVEIEKGLLNGFLNDFPKPGTNPGIDGQLQNIQKKITSLKSVKESPDVETELLSLRRAYLASRFPGSPLLIQTVNPWASFSPVSIPDGSSPSLKFTLTQGSYDFNAIAVTNLSAELRKIDLELDPVSERASNIFNVPFIKSAALAYVADPLVPFTGPVSLKPGESRLFFISAFGISPGKSNSTLRVRSDSGIIKVPVTSRVTGVRLPKNHSLNSVNWGYLDSNIIRDRQQVAAADLLAHHTNVVVVPPQLLPFADTVKTSDFVSLKKYLDTSKGATKALLYLAFESPGRSSLNGKYPFMGDSWKSWFKQWYKEAEKTAVSSGVAKGNLYIYPYDEMRSKNIDEFIQFASWARKELPEIRFYATINDLIALKTLGYLDVAQIADRDELLSKTGTATAERWIYNARGPAKSQSPYSYYRLMAWKAFLNGFKGIGFWAYADAGVGEKAGSVWDDFDGNNPDYAVIYDGVGNSIVSSRRWEAWRMGIEDYELLTMYARKKGESAAKALAKGVLDKPDDTTRADLVRRQILEELDR